MILAELSLGGAAFGRNHNYRSDKMFSGCTGAWQLEFAHQSRHGVWFSGTKRGGKDHYDSVTAGIAAAIRRQCGSHGLVCRA